MLYLIGNGDPTQILALKNMDESDFYHILPSHQKKLEREAKMPRMPFF